MMMRCGVCKLPLRPATRWTCVAAAAGILHTHTDAFGVILLSTGDPAANTTEPAGVLAGSGWQWQGTWGAFLGTAIDPHHFITAKHVGGSVGQSFVLNGVSYTTDAAFPDPASDLQIWRVTETFPSYAPLYSGSAEVGKDLVVFGRGTQRGNEVTVAGGTGGDQKGWLTGPSDGLQRWGENSVAGVYDAGVSLGQMLVAPFDLAAGGNEAHLSAGDSGGGLFVQDGGIWKLAGINYAVDGPFSLTAGGATFQAALFDMGGLFKGGTQIPDTLADDPSAFYATRISAHESWVASVVPEPQGVGFFATSLLGSIAGWRWFRRRRCGPPS